MVKVAKGKRAKKSKKETLDEKRYQQFRRNPEEGYVESEDDRNLTPREEDLNILLHGRKDIIDVINNN